MVVVIVDVGWLLQSIFFNNLFQSLAPLNRVRINSDFGGSELAAEKSNTGCVLKHRSCLLLKNDLSHDHLQYAYPYSLRYVY